MEFPRQKFLPESSASSQGFNLKGEQCRRDTEADSQFSWTAYLFQAKILFYTFTKALGQRFDIFNFPSPRFIASMHHCCPSSRVSASAVVSELCLL